MTITIKKWVFFLAAASVSTVHAQTATKSDEAPAATSGKITAPVIYGRFSAAIESSSIGEAGSRLALKSYSSRLGVRGEQTIDEDMNLFYGLEAQVLADSGATGLGGDLRNAYMGIKSKEWGTVVAGRLDPLVSAPLYLQIYTALDPVGMDTGSLQILAPSGRDTGTGSLLARSATTPAPTGQLSQSTQTLLARARVSNAVGYATQYKGFDVAARFVSDGPNDVVGISPNQLGETSARALEVAATRKTENWMWGVGFETNSYSADPSTTSSRFGDRFQFVTSVMLGGIRYGATFARNTVETRRAGADKSGNEFALAAKMPVMSGKAHVIANYAIRDLFGTDNSTPTAAGVPKPLATPGAKRKQLAVGLHYDINPSTMSYAVYNLTDGSNKASQDELTVIAAGLRHNF